MLQVHIFPRAKQNYITKGHFKILKLNNLMKSKIWSLLPSNY